MTRFTEHLWQDIVREHGAALARARRPEPSRLRRFKASRVIAGSTLGLAGAAAGLTLALSSTAAAPAFAVTTANNGTVEVTLNAQSALPQANQKLAAMGTGEQIEIQMAPGAATVPGAVTCTPAAGASGPAIQVLNGNDGTYVVPSGNTGAGSWHLASCTAFAAGSTAPAASTGELLKATPVPVASNSGS